VGVDPGPGLVAVLGRGDEDLESLRVDVVRKMLLELLRRRVDEVDPACRSGSGRSRLDARRDG
jgi:hypothetical protein